MIEKKGGAQEPKKLALIIAIGNYDYKETGWDAISSQNDLPIIREAFKRIGFAPDNIDELKEAEATAVGILKALDKLKEKASMGDMVAIHISSHGQQISDNDPPDEMDGKDEAIVAFGAPVSNDFWRKKNKNRGPAYDGSLHLRDDDLGNAINNIRAKVGKDGHVLVVLDACHSGTGTRGSSKVRGGKEAFIIEGAAKPISQATKEEGGFGVVEEGKSKTRGAGDNLAKFVLISGAAADQLNYEYEEEDKEKKTRTNYGSLSYCISRILPALPAGATYRTLFAKLQAEMADKAPQQSPQLEGDVDYQVFGGKFSPQPKYFEASKVINDRQVTIKAGSLMNIALGLTVVAEKAGEQPVVGKEPFGKGKVINVSNFESTIEFEKPIAIKNAKAISIYPTGRMIPDVKVKVNLDTIRNAELKKALKNAVAAMGMAEVVTGKGKGDITIKEAPSRGAPSLDLISTAFGSKLTEDPLAINSSEEAVKACTDRIQNFAQGKMFKSLSLKANEYDVRIVRILPVKPGTPRTKDANVLKRLMADTVDYKTLLDKGNSVNVMEGTYIFIEMQNFGDKVAYYNILDIQPNGIISSVLPRVQNGNVEPPVKELRLEPNEKKVIQWPLWIAPPYGNEMFKVIATGVEFDLASTIKAPAAATRGASNPLQKLVANSFNKEFRTRGPEAEFSDEMGTNTSEFTYKIIKRN